MALGTVRGQLGLMLDPWASGRVLDHQKRLLGLSLADDALLVLGLADTLQAKVAPAAEDQRPQSGDGYEDHDDGHHAGGGAVVHYRHACCGGEVVPGVNKSIWEAGQRGFVGLQVFGYHHPLQQLRRFIPVTERIRPPPCPRP